jgi:hypothetical protein
MSAMLERRPAPSLYRVVYRGAGHRPHRTGSAASSATKTQGRPSQGETAPPSNKAARTSANAEQAAHAAMAHEGLTTPSGDNVKLHLTISLTRRQSRAVTARAIRDGKNLEGRGETPGVV